MSDSFENAAIRLMIVGTAYLQALLGAHYVNGSDGDNPDCNDGNDDKRHIVMLEDHSWENLAVHAAAYGKKVVCRGRFDAVGGRVFKAPKGWETDTQDPLYQLKYEYMEKLKTVPPGQGVSFGSTGLFPRRGRSVSGDSIYLGEDCRDKRHFDCISFVKWVLSTVLQKKVSYDISQFQKGVAPVKVYKREEGAFPTPMNGDILTLIEGKHKHIGILTANRTVIHARYEAAGVQATGYKESDWTALCRLKDSYLKIGY